MLVRLNGMIREDQKKKIEELKKPGKSENAIVRDILDFYFKNTGKEKSFAWKNLF